MDKLANNLIKQGWLGVNPQQAQVRDLGENWAAAARKPWELLKTAISGSGSPAESLLRALGVNMPRRSSGGLASEALNWGLASAGVKLPGGFFSKLERNLLTRPFKQPMGEFPKAATLHKELLKTQLGSDEQKAIEFLAGDPKRVHIKDILQKVEPEIPQLQRKVLGGPSNDPTVHEQFSLGGSRKHYRENLWYYKPQAKAKASEAFGSYREPTAHFGKRKGENLLMWSRTHDRQLASGERVSYLDEAQSGWHQKGSGAGYGVPSWNELQKSGYSIRPAGNQHVLFDPDLQVIGLGDSPTKALQNAAKLGKLGVPDAPLKKDWFKTLGRDLVRDAVEKNHDGVAWSTADLQSKRWSKKFKKAYDLIYDKQLRKFFESEYGVKAVKKPTLVKNFDQWKIKVTGQSDLPFEVLDENGLVMFLGESSKKCQEFMQKFKSRAQEPVWYIPITSKVRQRVLTEGQRLSKNQSNRTNQRKALV